jgi:hypothetical protein
MCDDRLYGSVKAVGAVEPVYSSVAKEPMYKSLVIFQRGVYSKWFCVFDLSFWKVRCMSLTLSSAAFRDITFACAQDKINAVYCMKGAEMCHLTNDEREKQNKGEARIARLYR